jgi:tRNA threonylcarbamoyladenosine biosynthesis protein TsaE
MPHGIVSPFQSNSEAETLSWGQILASTLKPGDCLALHGNLGAGKTALCRGICTGLGFEGHVHSPSYALVHEYPNTPPLFHLDLYRLNTSADLLEIGVEHYAMSQGITMIEWPERLQDHSIVTHEITLKHTGEHGRLISLTLLRNL